MSNIIELFKQITQIPRCSGNHHPFIEFIKDFAYQNNYDCFIDQSNNILCKKKDSKVKLCLQSHYDIVCLVDNTIPQIIEENGYLKAKNSTLGADNGIGCAYMLALMKEHKECEFLFTSDEEIGLIGANNLGLQITASYMLNLDSEAEGEICIGCAGGVDIFATTNEHKLIHNENNLDLYEISISHLPGGHSGVDIHQNIPNAIKILAQAISEADALLLDFNAGERINSIPVNAKAIIASKKQPPLIHEHMKIEKISRGSEHFNVYSNSIINFINHFKNGVLEKNPTVDVIETSINLAKVSTHLNGITLEFSARSMDNNKLKELTQKTIKELEQYGFSVQTDGKYPAWKPDINEFTNTVLEIYKKYQDNANLKAIHAGLECAIFKDKFTMMNIVSIGPNIHNPHSNAERVEIQSVHNVYKIVQEIVNTL